VTGLGPNGATRVLVATRPVDFRKGMDGLAALVTAQLGGDPFSGVVYVFREKLEAGAFSWPSVHDGAMRLTAAQLGALLEGLDWRRVHQARRTRVPRIAG
jgi:transposase